MPISEPSLPVHFSSRTEFGAEADALTEAAAEMRAAGATLLDLTESNPTRCGLALDASVLLPALASEANLKYRADPFGPIEARRAVAEQYYGERGVVISPDRVVLTASTSEAYSFLFRLLCEPGDTVLVPQPSYPLFDLLARMCDVELRPYPLRWHDRWEIDMIALEAAVTPRTRGIVVVHPNNPTGHFASEAERFALGAFAARHGVPLLVDEVFLDYAVEASPERSFAELGGPKALTFVMSGLSKVLALPQMKLAWTLVLGPEAACQEALHRLEFVADTFLSVAAPAANAVSQWLEHADSLQGAVRARVQENLVLLDALLAGQALVSRLRVEAGWCVLLRIPAIEADGEFALRLLREEQVLVYPGSFFGLGRRGWLVVSLLLETTAFEQATVRVLRAVLRRAGEASW